MKPYAETLAVDDLPFDDAPELNADAAPATIKDVQDADALEIALMKWRINVCAKQPDDKMLMKHIKQRGGIKPKVLARAAVLFKDVISDTDEWWVIYVACKCAEIKNDTGALKLFDVAIATGLGTDKLKKAIRKANATGKPKAAPLAERCAMLVKRWRDIPDIFARASSAGEMQIYLADELAALPEVRRALERKPEVSNAGL